MTLNNINPRTYEQSHASTVVQVGVDGLLLGFCCVTIFYKVWFVFWVGALLGAGDVIQTGRPLEFYSNGRNGKYSMLDMYNMT